MKKIGDEVTETVLDRKSIENNFQLANSTNQDINNTFNDFNPKPISKHNKTLSKLGLLEWMLIAMAIVVLITGIALFIVFFLVDKVPSILLNDKISKSLLDTRKYEMVRLLNDIEVLLVSDPSTSNSAVGLTSNSGIADDSKYNIYGIGNLVKRLLANGKAKKQLDYLISQSFGFPLKLENYLLFTSYSYDVGNENFMGAIEAFADMIKLRDLDNDKEELKKRILSAVDEIDEKDKKTDENEGETVITNIIWSMIGEKKQYFPTGSKKTFLNETFTIENLTEAVIRYYKENYQGKKMKIVVMSYMKIKEMKGIVIKLFSDVNQALQPLYPSNSTKTSNSNNNNANDDNSNRNHYNDINGQSNNSFLPYSNYPLGKLLITKFTNEKIFKVSFLIDNIPLSTKYFYFRYIKYLLDDQVEGSLNFLLKKDNFIVRQSLLYDYLKNNTIIVSFSFELTQKGLTHIDEVLLRIFNYLKILRKQKPNRKLYEDLNRILYHSFQYQDVGMEHYNSKVRMLVTDILRFSDSLNNLTMNKYYLPEYNQEFLDKIFDMFTPSNSIVLVNLKSKKIEEKVIACLEPLIKGNIVFTKDTVNPVYYSITSFSDYSLKQFAYSSTFDNEFKERKKNNYITNITALVDSQSEEESRKRAPQLLFDETHAEIWHKTDRSFRIPKTLIYLNFLSPFIPSDNPLNWYLFYYHFNYVRTAYYMEFSGATEAGSDVNVMMTNNKLEVIINTFSDLFERILNKALEIYFNIETSFVSESLIQNLTEEHFNAYSRSSIYSKTSDIMNAAIKNNMTSLLKSIPTQFEFNITERANLVLNETYIRSLIYGNINKEDAKRIVKQSIFPHLNQRSLYYSSKYCFFNEKELISYILEKKDFNGNFIIKLKSELKDSSTYVGNYFYMGSNRNHRDEMLILFIKLIVENVYKSHLDKLDYPIKSAFIDLFEDNYYYVIYAYKESAINALTPKKMCKTLDEILNKAREHLVLIDEEKELYRFKQNVLLELNKKDQNLIRRAKKVTKEIYSGRYMFDPDVEYTIEKLNREYSLQDIIDKFDCIFYKNVKRISFQKAHNNEIDLSDDQYTLNEKIYTTVTDDLEYFHKKKKPDSDM